MMMNRPSLFSPGIFRLASLAVCSLLLASCVNPKEVLYIQDITGETRQDIVTKYQTTIQKDDQLYISVSSKQPELRHLSCVRNRGCPYSRNIRKAA